MGQNGSVPEEVDMVVGAEKKSRYARTIWKSVKYLKRKVHFARIGRPSCLKIVLSYILLLPFPSEAQVKVMP